MKTYLKKDFPVSEIRRFLEPGPIVLLSSRWKEEQDVMTMGWHTVLEFSPSLIGCMITSSNHSFDLIRKSKECVINIPTVDLLETTVKIGNCSGTEVDKFAEFGLTAQTATKVKAPLIKECFANLECRLKDSKLVSSYNFFIFEVVKAHAPKTPKYPRTFHYTGDGVFMLSGEHVSKRKFFKSEYL
ncbi:flavin reductase family protein [Bdellovibrio sp. HCB209]|uniref:flavin reductase family protein n=1 Tax=Bdellovibrio sp. HCB209 TaxID=3394354 RepID=UPI0039B5D22D